MNKSDKLIEDNLIWCAIPVYNNRKTVREIAQKTRTIIKNVVVVDDGSTDADISSLLSGLDLTVLKHEKNRGKGAAILTASRYVEKQGGRSMITLDADGQHNPGDIRKFIPLILEDETNFIIGCRDFNTGNVPVKSKFGRKFANFWLRVEAGIYIDDCQSGFRAYPVRYINQLKFLGKTYNFEAEVLAKAAWAGLKLKSVPIEVYYPEAHERVSHFRPFLDNFRLSLMHTHLVGRHLFPLRPKRLIEEQEGTGLDEYKKLIWHPVKLLKLLLLEHSSPEELALSAAVGAFLSIVPLVAVHTLVIIYFSVRLHLNKVLAINIQHFFMPPLSPALCIELGYFMRNGYWLTEISFETVFTQFSSRLFEWFLGSLILAPLGAMVTGMMVFFLARSIQRRQSVTDG